MSFSCMRLFIAGVILMAPLIVGVRQTPAKAEGGCPTAMVPVGGGYCRNIVCVPNQYGGAAEALAAKYNLKCGYGREHFGDVMVPMLTKNR